MFFIFIFIFSFFIWFSTIKYFKNKISKGLLTSYSLIFWISVLFRNIYYFQLPMTKTYFFVSLLKINSFMLSIIAYFHVCLLLILIIERFKKKSIFLKPNALTGRRRFLGLSTIAPVITLVSNYKISYPITKRVEIIDKDFPKDISLKIGQLTDLHIGPTLKYDFLNRVCLQLMKEKPDIIFITGDIVDGTVNFLKKELLPLQMLKAPQGVFLVDGNHEYYWNITQWRKYYKGLSNIKMLNNENVTINIDDKKILIAGVTDLRAHRFGDIFLSSPSKAIKSNQNHNYKILLAHRPKSCYQAAKVGFNLQVSGHTHGGQSIPFNLIVKLFQPYLSGLYKHKAMNLYVSNGTGYWGPSMRLGIPGEITILNLKNEK